MVLAKVDVLNLIFFFPQTLLIEWASDVMWFQERIPKRHMVKEIGLWVQNMITILGSIVDIIFFYFFGGNLYEHLMSMRIFSLRMNKIII